MKISGSLFLVDNDGRVMVTIDFRQAVPLPRLKDDLLVAFAHWMRLTDEQRALIRTDLIGRGSETDDHEEHYREGD